MYWFVISDDKYNTTIGNGDPVTTDVMLAGVMIEAKNIVNCLQS